MINEKDFASLPVIYRGGNHVVVCDSEYHYAIDNRGHHERQCVCFCRDPEYLRDGFTAGIWDRYLVKPKEKP